MGGQTTYEVILPKTMNLIKSIDPISNLEEEMQRQERVCLRHRGKQQNLDSGTLQNNRLGFLKKQQEKRDRGRTYTLKDNWHRNQLKWKLFGS